MSYTFGNPASGHTKVDNSGRFSKQGGATEFIDWLIPMSNVRVNPGTSKPDWNGTYFGYDFPYNDDTEYITGLGQLNHNYKEGSAMYPHLHYLQETTHWISSAEEVPVFSLEYCIVNPGNEIPDLSNAANWTTISLDTSSIAGFNGTVQLHQILAPATDEIAGNAEYSSDDIKISALIWVRLRRTEELIITEDVTALSLDFHMEEDTGGSNSPLIK